MESVTTPKVTREEIIVFTRDEINALLKASEGHKYHVPVLLASKTGMRLSEVLVLRWQDVDFDEDCIYIRQTLQRASTGIIFEEPKTKNSKRKITITPITM